MTSEEIKNGESKNVEFKVQISDDSKKYMKTIVAYANTSGGKIVIGVDEYPGQNRPYYIRNLVKENGPYIRVAGTSRPADEAILKDLEYQVAGKSFDEMVNMETDFDEKDAHKLCSDIRTYIAESKEIPLHKAREITFIDLENWGILKKSGQTYLPTNAFVLLTKNTFRFAKVQCALFKGDNRAVFIDRREFDGPVYEQIEEAFQFVLKHINLGAEIEGIVRKDKNELPPESIREAIINAVCHRCYLDHSCVQVAVYDNRVEITSPGMLYGGLTVEQMMAGRSKIRNVCIAEVFSRMGIIEQWGTGIQRMIQGCREYGVHEPEFIDLGDGFRVNFYRAGIKAESKETVMKHEETAKLAADLSGIEKKAAEYILDHLEIFEKFDQIKQKGQAGGIYQ